MYSEGQGTASTSWDTQRLLLFSPPRIVSATYHGGNPPRKNCEPPFGFCHEHTVGYGYDEAANVDGGFGETVSFIAALTAKSLAMKHAKTQHICSGRC